MNTEKSEIQEPNLKGQFFQAFSFYKAALQNPFKGSGKLSKVFINHVNEEIEKATEFLKTIENDLPNWSLAKIDEFIEDMEEIHEEVQYRKDHLEELSIREPEYKEIENNFGKFIDQFMKVYESAEAIIEEEEKKQDHRMSLKSMWKDWDTEADKHWESM